ncbi:hypothetical protein GAO09_09695 [Rhizobiales bacterium RZME27]|uniref:Uncharacterized protein n=1 Tax=Endobacterium cereale TaxID=2663029 RepID=A0A6A8AC43_9HYPH|nr:DUF6665 family protein [Endobacterium cereale]MEB2846386.1 DUF6665 family protein [Endobacterium cereale]MQY46321.1 hypothetical protein [Endobacterium cereale]
MTVRPPGNFGQSGPVMSGMATLEYELMAERAYALGRHGTAVEKAIAALKNAQSKPLDTIERERLLDDASEAVWGLFVHRETCGLRNDDEVIKDYDIPPQVLARLGAKPRHR